MKNYKANPVTVQAVQYTGTSQSKLEVRDFTKQLATTARDASGKIQLALVTENGSHFIFENNYVVLSNGKYSVIPEDIFEQNYSEVVQTESPDFKEENNHDFSNPIFDVSRGTGTLTHSVPTTTSSGESEIIITADSIIENKNEESQNPPSDVVVDLGQPEQHDPEANSNPE